ncbi:hypothetical protein [Streptomyces sp. NPDC048639]|uniref:hypothetical protein n=1 Tax=Streptomyces sp. NPDC048639 TaxID=3365581 RepID=UPI00371BFB54
MHIAPDAGVDQLVFAAMIRRSSLHYSSERVLHDEQLGRMTRGDVRITDLSEPHA